MTSPAGAASGVNGANGGDGGDAGQVQGQGQEAAGPDLGALAEQLGHMSQGQEEMRQFLMSQPWTQQGEQGDEGAEAEVPPIDLSQLDELGYDQQAAEALAQTIERQWQQREEALRNEFRRELGTVNERVSERERMEQMRDLVDEFPDMAKPEVAKPIVGQAHELVQANGWPAELAADPRFWRITYAAQQAFAAAQEEGRDDPDAAHLEGGAGAASAGGQRGQDLGEAIVNAAGGGRSVLPF